MKKAVLEIFEHSFVWSSPSHHYKHTYCTNAIIISESVHMKESYHKIPKSKKVILYKWYGGMWDLGTASCVKVLELHWVTLSCGQCVELYELTLAALILCGSHPESPKKTFSPSFAMLGCLTKIVFCKLHHISYALIYLQWLIWDLRAKRQINYFPSLCKHEEYMKDGQYNFDPRIYLICALCKIKLPPEKWSTETETLKKCHKDSVNAIQFAG